MSFDCMEFCNAFQIAIEFIEELILSATDMYSRDIQGYFIYKPPESMTSKDSSSSEQDVFKNTYAKDNFKKLSWITIQEFSYLKAVYNLNDFIKSWVLTPDTKYEMVKHAAFEDVENLGTTFFVDAIFSKPTQACPQPLPTVTVFFEVHLSLLLPLNYPIMVTYTFENFGTVFYALGEKCFEGNFQKFFIDNILQFKLKFFEDAIKWSHEFKEKERIKGLNSCDEDEDDEDQNEDTKKGTNQDNKKRVSISGYQDNSSDDSEMKYHRPPSNKNFW